MPPTPSCLPPATCWASPVALTTRSHPEHGCGCSHFVKCLYSKDLWLVLSPIRTSFERWLFRRWLIQGPSAVNSRLGRPTLTISIVELLLARAAARIPFAHRPNRRYTPYTGRVKLGSTPCECISTPIPAGFFMRLPSPPSSDSSARKFGGIGLVRL